MMTTEQIQELNKLGYNFHWNNISREYFDDSGDYERGIAYDPLRVGHPSPFTLRSRIWNDERGQYEYEYERFESFVDLRAYLS